MSTDFSVRAKTISPLLGFVIFAVALFVRLYQIDSIPPGVQGDELFNLIDAKQIGWGNFPVFFEGNFGREPLYFYLLRLSIGLFGESIWAMRLPSAVLGAGNAWVAWAIGRERFNWRIGLVAAGLIALSLWPVLHGRIALRAVSLTFFGGVAILLWGRVLYGDSKRFYLEAKGRTLGAGIALGLVFYTYIPGRIFGLIMVAWIVWMGLFERERIKERWRPVLITFGVAFVVMLPLLWYAFTTPELFNQRIVSSGSQQWGRGIQAVLGMFSVRGDSDWRYWIEHRPLFRPGMSALFYVGVVVCGWRSFVGERRGVHLMILAWMVNQIALNLVLGQMFMALRTAGAVIPVYLIVGIGLDALWGVIHAKAQRREVEVAVILVMFGLVGWHSWASLQMWAAHPKVREIYQVEVGEMGRYLRENRGDERRFLGVEYAYDAPTVVGLNLYRPGNYSLYDVETAVPLASNGELITAKSDPLPPFGRWDAQSINESSHIIKPAEPFQYTELYTPFENGLALIGYREIASVERGEIVPLVFVFEVEDGIGSPNELTTLNVELMSRGSVYAQHSTLIGYPQASWALGDQFAQFTALEIPDGIPAAPAQLRLTLSDADGTAIGGDVVTPLFDIISNEVVEAYVPAEDTLIFGDTIALDSVTMSTLAAPGLSHDLALDWVPLAPITEPLTVVFLLVDEEDTAVYMHTTPLGDDTWPATSWRENERVTIQYRLNLPIDLTSRENDLVVRLFDLDVTNGESAVSPLTLNIHERLFTLPDLPNSVDHVWKDGISLHGYGLEETADTLKLTLAWQATAVPQNDYTIFNHLIAADGILSGTLAAQLDAPPQHPASQTRTWQVGEVIVEERVIDVSGVPAGAYQLIVGMYDRATVERLGVVGGGDSVVLGEVVR